MIIRKNVTQECAWTLSENRKNKELQFDGHTKENLRYRQSNLRPHEKRNKNTGNCSQQRMLWESESNRIDKSHDIMLNVTFTEGELTLKISLGNIRIKTEMYTKRDTLLKACNQFLQWKGNTSGIKIK